VGGKILCAEIVRHLARGRGGYEFESVGELALKGIPDPVPAVEVHRAPVVQVAMAREIAPRVSWADEPTRHVLEPEQSTVTFVAGGEGFGLAHTGAGELGVGEDNLWEADRLGVSPAQEVHETGRSGWCRRCLPRDPAQHRHRDDHSPQAAESGPFVAFLPCGAYVPTCGLTNSEGAS
jgi:hypothetical protein